MSSTKGKLVMAAAAIGNPADFPARSLAALRDCDLLIFEEHRGARAALKAAGVHRPYLRYSEQQQRESIEAISDALKQGESVCYMSDQGCPCLEDPGSPVLALAYKLGASVEVIPGPSALTAALSACPFDTRGFVFAGLLSRQQGERTSGLKKLKSQGRPVAIMDAPYRIKQLLEDSLSVYGPACRALLSLDISGEDEQHLWLPLREMSRFANALDKKLNFVLILPGAAKAR